MDKNNVDWRRFLKNTHRQIITNIRYVRILIKILNFKVYKVCFACFVYFYDFKMLVYVNYRKLLKEII